MTDPGKILCYGIEKVSVCDLLMIQIKKDLDMLVLYFLKERKSMGAGAHMITRMIGNNV